MVKSQVVRPTKLNIDKSPLVTEPSEAIFLLNQERMAYGVVGKTIPCPANELFSALSLPAGENYTIGCFSSKKTNEIFYVNWNNNGDHSIIRVTDAFGTEVMFTGPLPQIDAMPEHALANWRFYLMEEKNNCGNRHGRYLIFVNGVGRITCIDIEASIITDSFTTSYFLNSCGFIEDYSLLAVPEICECPGVEALPNTTPSKENRLNGYGWQFRIQHEYYDGRKSEWSTPSTMYYGSSGNCLVGESGPRCLRLTFPIGNAMVTKIHIAYRKDNDQLWYLADTIEKYRPYDSDNQYWYERSMNISVVNCKTTYEFCNEKLCTAIPAEETTRVYNPEPMNVQGLFGIDSRIGFYNYEKGVCNLSIKELNKLSFGVEQKPVDCLVETAKVKVAVIVHNVWNDRNQFIFRLNGTDEAKDDKSDRAFFGGLLPALNGGFDLDADQYFKGETRNFIAYIEGTDYYGEMKQYFRSAAGDETEYGVVPNLGDTNTRNRWRRATRRGEYFFQMVELEVPKGTKGFVRLASHFAQGNDQGTSTSVYGVLRNRRDYSGDSVIRPNSGGFNAALRYDIKEIYFDTCNGDVDMTNTPFVVADLNDGGARAVSYGYVRDKNGSPVENLSIAGTFGSRYVFGSTDHNGFYFVMSEYKTQIQFQGETGPAAWTTLHTIGTSEWNNGAATQNDVDIDNQTYADDFYATAKITVKDCVGQAVAGITIAVGGAKAVVTNAIGEAIVQVRNNKTRRRSAIIVVMRNGACAFYDCNGNCNPCMFDTLLNWGPSFQGTPQLVISPVNIGTIGTVSSGLKAGGRYEMGIVVKGNGRISFVQRNNWFVSPPTTQDKNGWSFPRITWQMNQPMIFPDWAECFSFWRTENLNGFKLQWVVDKIEFVDAKGAAAGVAAAKQIRLTIQSLNDYNKSYFFKTNTKYQYLDGDRVEFIQNGDGKIFQGRRLEFRINSPFLNKDEEGVEETPPADFFNQILVDNDPDLRGLKEGAIIELKGTAECQTEPKFYSICGHVDIRNGLAVRTSGFINTFDTFFVTRVINDKAPVKFEHHSPSDLWGERLSDAGIPFIANDKEVEKRYGRNIALSLARPFNWFDESQVRTIDGKEQGDIVAMNIWDTSTVLGICENDNFIVQVGDDFVRSSPDGLIRVTPGSLIISDPQSRVAGQYGCAYEDIGSVYFGDGFATWVDAKRMAFAYHDLQQAIDISDGQVKSYITAILNAKNQYNKSNPTISQGLYRFITGFNEGSGDIMLTTKRLRDAAVNSSIEFDLNDYQTLLPRTLVFSSRLKDFPCFLSIIPDAYGYIHVKDADGCNFMAISRGDVYVHPVKNTVYNRFFGIFCDRVIKVAFNDLQDKEKMPIAFEIQDRVPWLIHNIVTDNGMQSETPVIHGSSTGGHWNIPVLGDINSPGGLFGNEKPYGYYIVATFVRDNTDSGKYGTVDTAKQGSYDEMGGIIVKFMLVEQSGYGSK